MCFIKGHIFNAQNTKMKVHHLYHLCLTDISWDVTKRQSKKWTLRCCRPLPAVKAGTNTNARRKEPEKETRGSSNLQSNVKAGTNTNEKTEETKKRTLGHSKSLPPLRGDTQATDSVEDHHSLPDILMGPTKGPAGDTVNLLDVPITGLKSGRKEQMLLLLKARDTSCQDSRVHISGYP